MCCLSGHFVWTFGAFETDHVFFLLHLVIMAYSLTAFKGCFIGGERWDE